MNKEAMKLAIELEDIQGLSAIDGTTVDKAAAELMRLSALEEQPAQHEPVGEAYLCDKCSTPFDGEYYCPECGHNTATKEPVYTRPQVLEWAGLTKKEVYDLYDLDYAVFYQRIEAKLKEKNT